MLVNNWSYATRFRVCLRPGESDLVEEKEAFERGDFASRLEEVEQNVRKYGNPDVVKYVAGWYQETLDQLAGIEIACVFLDVDLEESITVCLDKLWKSIAPGCKVFVHDVDRARWFDRSRIAAGGPAASALPFHRLSETAADLAGSGDCWGIASRPDEPRRSRRPCHRRFRAGSLPHGEQSEEDRASFVSSRSEPSLMKKCDSRRVSRASVAVTTLVPGALLILVGAAGAVLLRGLAEAWASQPERVMQAAGLGTMAVVGLPIVLYLARRRSAASPGRAGLLLLAGGGAALLAFYLTWTSYHVEYPADFLMWAEGDFVNEIIKFRTGHPLYTAQQNNESMTYTPGAPLLTYALALLVGAPDSIPVYRLIQLVYCLGAATAALGCFFRVIQFSGAPRFAKDKGLWAAIALPLFFLVSSNSITNPFIHNLHNDSLAQLAAIVSYWLLLEYVATGRKFVLALMVLMPAAGFMVKQSLAIWAPLYCFYFLFFDSPRSLGRVAAFGVASFGALALVVGGCYALWGAPFWYWAVVVMGSYRVPLLRSVQHGLVVWPYYAIGLAAGLVFLRGLAAKKLVGPWLIWFLFFGAETYTSGLNVTLNHMGPGCLIASIWFLAAVARLWSADRLLDGRLRHQLSGWTRAAFARRTRGAGLRRTGHRLDADQSSAA